MQHHRSQADEHTRFLVIGAGISGLSFAARVASDSCLILESEAEIGGYCRTIVQDGFVWDYSGHFFHFKHPDIEAELIAAMGDQRILKVRKVSWIRHGDRYIDFPFQKNIHQLPQPEFLECLHDLVFRDGATTAPRDFKDMLYRKLGRGIAEKFLIPYNTKLYATDLAHLDADAMGRFFPHADLKDIVANFTNPDNASYNATFTYPEGGAIQYVHAIASRIDPARIRTNHRVLNLDTTHNIATVRGPDGAERRIAYDHVISSAPFPKLLAMCGHTVPPGLYTANKVLVFNLGFDRKGPPEPHWIYYADPSLVFYRVGFYDNIFGTERMSIYVEIGLPDDHPLDMRDDDAVHAYRTRVLADLERVGLVDGHQLVSHAAVLLDPAYAHITTASRRAVQDLRETLATAGIYSVGRYGGWTYCSIEDNIVEARALADRFNAMHRA
jgi:protoporphyrinogen oxidase